MWLSDVNQFCIDLKRHSSHLGYNAGYQIAFDTDNPDKLKVAHENWHAQCDLWQSSYVMPNSDGLSHLKIMAILLYQLASVEWVRDIYEWDDAASLVIFGRDRDREENRQDICAGRGTYLGFQFVISVLDIYEGARIGDRAQPFLSRLTSDLEHDLIVYLMSERRDEMATFLILKALYARD